MLLSIGASKRMPIGFLTVSLTECKLVIRHSGRVATMTGQRIAYKRVSTVTQSTDRQLDGLTFDEVFEDKVSGKSKERPALKAALQHCRRGDRLIVHSMDRLARNLADLLSL